MLQEKLTLVLRAEQRGRQGESLGLQEDAKGTGKGESMVDVEDLSK